VARDDRTDDSREDRRGERRRPDGNRSSRRARLDQPRDTRRSFVRRPRYDADTFGRLSERIARFLGTGRFLVYMTVSVTIWLVWNFFGPPALRWDDYPFIFLTLMLSLQASYAAPLILLAQNRQEARDRVNMEQDRDANARAHADMQFLAREVASLRISVGEVATRDYLRSELRGLLGELEERVAGAREGPPASVDERVDPAARSLES
jgi:uncharacterized membrane protein